MKAHKCNLAISMLSYFARMDAARVIEKSPDWAQPVEHAIACSQITVCRWDKPLRRNQLVLRRVL